MEGLVERLHVLVIGPGLGREERTQAIGRLALQVAKAQSKYVVLDADGLWLIQNEPDLIKGYKRAVLTPNVVEFKRLCEAMVSHPRRTLPKPHINEFSGKLQSIPKDAPADQLAGLLARAFGNITILQKGPSDIISNGDRTETVSIEGGLKRVGGQGDILSGVTGTFLAWGKNFEEKQDENRSVNLISTFSSFQAL